MFNSTYGDSLLAEFGNDYQSLPGDVDPDTDERQDTTHASLGILIPRPTRNKKTSVSSDYHANFNAC